jgi:methionine-rich copper-binding protein CopC
MGFAAARRWSAVALAGLVAGAVALPSPAPAHGGLAGSLPANGSMLGEPVDAVTLTFTEKPAPFAYFTVTAPTGDRVDGGWSNAEPARLATPVREYQVVDGKWTPQLYHTGFPVKVAVSHWPAAGPYVVRYHTVASDGDQVEGEVRFSYAGAVTAARPGWQPPVDQPGPELVPAQAQQQPPPQPRDETRMWRWLVPALLVAAAGLSYLVIRPPGRLVGRRAPRPATGRVDEL